MTDLTIKDIARKLVTGDGTPRTREQLLSEVTSALAAAYARGAEDGERRARALAKSAPLAALDAAIADLTRTRTRLAE